MISALKWTATAILIVGSAVNGLGYYPLGPLILVLGGAIWFAVAVKLKDLPLMITNAVMGLVGLLTVFYTLYNLDSRPEGAIKADEYYQGQDNEVEEMQPPTRPESELRLLHPGTEPPTVALWVHQLQGPGLPTS